MSEVGAEIIKTEETQESGVKYLNINVSNSEVERDPDIVRLCADAGILEYAKPCDNVISRQETIKYLCTNMNWHDEDGGIADDEEKLNAITDLVNGVPSVTQQFWKDKYIKEINHLRKYISKLETQIVEQEQKTGHWILQPSNKEQGERDFIWWKCSKCGQVIFSETEKDRREFQAFCSRCGAKMVDSQERE
jgi:hypothetical protein